jgi:hypothetical protein
LCYGKLVASSVVTQLVSKILGHFKSEFLTPKEGKKVSTNIYPEISGFLV